VILIWGLRVIYKTLAEGMFFCPGCGGDRDYRGRQARRWFTLFWVPVIPLRVLGDVVECGTCGNRYDDKVLDLPTSAQLAAALQQGMRALVTAVLRSGNPGDRTARALAVEAVWDVGGSGYDDDRLSQELATVPQDVRACLTPLAGQLEVAGREAFLSQAVRIAVADGPATEDECLVMHSAGEALQMTPVHIQGVLDAVSRTAAD